MRSTVAMGKEGRPVLFAVQRAQDQASQLCLRHNNIHLVEKLKLAFSLGDQFKSGGGESGLFHLGITFESGAKMTFQTFSK